MGRERAEPQASLQPGMSPFAGVGDESSLAEDIFNSGRSFAIHFCQHGRRCEQTLALV